MRKLGKLLPLMPPGIRAEFMHLVFMEEIRALASLVFRNQGACLQCHKIDGQGGEQGPELGLVGDRMEPSKLLESLVNPNAEISPGYGLSTVR